MNSFTELQAYLEGLYQKAVTEYHQQQLSAVEYARERLARDLDEQRRRQSAEETSRIEAMGAVESTPVRSVSREEQLRNIQDVETTFRDIVNTKGPDAANQWMEQQGKDVPIYFHADPDGSVHKSAMPGSGAWEGGYGVDNLPRGNPVVKNEAPATPLAAMMPAKLIAGTPPKSRPAPQPNDKKRLMTGQESPQTMSAVTPSLHNTTGLPPQQLAVTIQPKDMAPPAGVVQPDVGLSSKRATLAENEYAPQFPVGRLPRYASLTWQPTNNKQIG